MVAPVVLGALITAGSSILGAGMNAQARKRSDRMNSPAGIRANAEKAGFNPLLFVGPGTGTGAQYAPTMGNIIANAGAAIGNQVIDGEALQIQKAELEMENQRLQHLIEQTTLRAPIPGIYGARNANYPRNGGDDLGDDDPPIDLAGDAGPPSELNVNQAPQVSAFGYDLVGSGRFSSGQTVEDAIGESPLSWLAAPAIMGDMLGYSIGRRIGYSRTMSEISKTWATRKRPRPTNPKPFEMHTDTNGTIWRYTPNRGWVDVGKNN